MGIGGLIGGLGQTNAIIQNGGLQGQIQGNEMQFERQAKLAEIMRQSALGEAQQEELRGRAAMYRGQNDTKLGVANTSADAKRDVGAGNNATALTMEDVKAALAKQHESDAMQLGTDRNAWQAQRAQAQSDLARASQERMNAILGNSYAKSFLDTTEPLRKTMTGYAAADAALAQAKQQNPAAVRATLLSLAQNDTGGGGARKAVIDYAAQIHPDIVGRLQQNLGLITSGALSDQDIDNIAKQISQQHRTAKSLYTQQFVAQLKAHPGAESSFAPYAPDTQFDIPGNPSGMGTNAQAAPPIQQGPATGMKYRPNNPFAAPGAPAAPMGGPPTIPPPVQPMAPGATATPGSM